MFWRDDTDEIVVVGANGSWSSFSDTWPDNPGPPDGGPPPANRQAPGRSFRTFWRDQAVVRADLGWATSPEFTVEVALQEFAGGRMLAIPGQLVYVFFQDGTWQSFVAELPATPAN
jgi:hypothetical protein